jgi:hypothetical protein
MLAIVRLLETLNTFTSPTTLTDIGDKNYGSESKSRIQYAHGIMPYVACR